jgi:nucleotide-binding universal stress UspA family protein
MEHIENGTGRIVVGIDGSAHATRALVWALAQAASSGAKVRVVHAWQMPTVYEAGIPVPPSEEHVKAADAALGAAVERAAADWPEVRVETRLVEGHPARALLDQAVGADLLVVGSRGHGGFVGALLGSVGHYCIQHATCPVVVVRGESHGPAAL